MICPSVRITAILRAGLVASVCAAPALAQQAGRPEHTKDSLATVKQNLAEKKAILLDVREESEWNAGRLEQAILLPLSRLKGANDPKAVTKHLDPKQIIYCHCRSGGRTLLATEILRQQGFDVRPLKAGYEDLLKAGFPKAAVSAE